MYLPCFQELCSTFRLQIMTTSDFKFYKHPWMSIQTLFSLHSRYLSNMRRSVLENARGVRKVHCTCSTCSETPLNLFAAPKKVSGQTLSPFSLTRALCPSHFPQHCVPFITQAAALQANTVSFTVTVKAMHS